MITATMTVVASKEQVSCDLAGEAAILNLSNGFYYGLGPVGARIWNLIQTGVRVSAIRDAIVREYNVEAERCENDLLALLGELEAHKLIEVRDEAAA
jgi:hypothetical protein